ncbi:MAG: DNA adenine methylase [Candidatus Kuenenia sp.]|nr:DNA adenine methylase [Candidatus Kuenenia sp.]
MKAPFPYFGGKSTIAHKVWAVIGDCKHYIEPFFGSGAVLLSRPKYIPGKDIETICDKDGYICNVWRALQHNPDKVAKWCDWPVNHCCPAGTMIATPNGFVPIEKIYDGMIVWGYEDGHIVQTKVLATTKNFTADPLVSVGKLSLTVNHPIWTTKGYMDAISFPDKALIGIIDLPVDKPLFNIVECQTDRSQRNIYQSSNPKRLLLQRSPLSIPITVCNFETTTGNYFAEQLLVHNCDLSARKKELIKNEQNLLENLFNNPDWYDAKLAGYWIWAASCWIGSGLTRIGQMPHVSKSGMGVHSVGQMPHVSNGGMGVQEPYNTNIYTWFRQLSERLRYVRVVCGDWTRVCGGNWQDDLGICGMFFDPPYGVVDRDTNIYHCDSTDITRDISTWCKERGKISTYRIVIAGYEEHAELLQEGWTSESWSAQGGYANVGKKRVNANRDREILYYSPYCIKLKQKALFV